jgi:hypothetical protein
MSHGHYPWNVGSRRERDMAGRTRPMPLCEKEGAWRREMSSYEEGVLRQIDQAFRRDSPGLWHQLRRPRHSAAFRIGSRLAFGGAGVLLLAAGFQLDNSLGTVLRVFGYLLLATGIASALPRLS